jgi:sensor domain CHASE-containing protein
MNKLVEWLILGVVAVLAGAITTVIINITLYE